MIAEFRPELVELLKEDAKEWLVQHQKGFSSSFIDFPKSQEEIATNTVSTEATIQTEHIKDVVEFKVGGILDRKWSRTNKKYLWLVNWEGYGKGDNTWEPEEVFKDGEVVNDIFLQYEEMHPRLQKRVTRLTKAPPKKKRNNGVVNIQLFNKRK